MFEGDCAGVGVTRVVPNIDCVTNHILHSVPKARIVTEMPCTVCSAGRRTRPCSGRNGATTSPWSGVGTESKTIRRRTLTPGSQGATSSPSNSTTTARAQSIAAVSNVGKLFAMHGLTGEQTNVEWELDQ